MCQKIALLDFRTSLTTIVSISAAQVNIFPKMQLKKLLSPQMQPIETKKIGCPWFIHCIRNKLKEENKLFSKRNN